MKLPPEIFIEVPINTVEVNKRGFTILGGKINAPSLIEKLIKIDPDRPSLSLNVTKGWRGFPITLEQLAVISLLPSYESIYSYLNALGHDFNYPQLRE